VLVWHDVLGLSTGHVPKFVKQYANLGEQIAAALAEYVADVRRERFPAVEHTYAMPEAERKRFELLSPEHPVHPVNPVKKPGGSGPLIE
jgi:hypothetical protein